MARVKGPNEEAEWQAMDKRLIRAMLAEMNLRDRAARGRGVRLADYVNANGLIPEALASRLSGGSRFFDPEHIRDRLKAPAQAQKPQAQPQQPQQSRSDAQWVDEFRKLEHRDGNSRQQRKAMWDPSHPAYPALMRAKGLIPSQPTQAPTASPQPAPPAAPQPGATIRAETSST